eukprot:84712_1
MNTNKIDLLDSHPKASMSFLLILSTVVTLITTSHCSVIQTLWPLPQTFRNGSDVISLCDYTDLKINSNVNSSTLINAIQRFETYLQTAPSSFTKRKSVKHSSNRNHNTKITTDTDCLSTVDVLIDSTNSDLSISTDYNYTLQINASSITMHSGSIYGTVYAFITLTQLIRFDEDYSSNIIANTPWFIDDYPSFNYRSLMIDTGRNYLPVSLIKQTVFAMSLNKMNVLNWHIIDAQSFPFDSTSHPELSAFGSYGRDFIYHPSDIADIVSYAKQLGIRVIPEWESPGHDTSIGFGAPDAMICNTLADNDGHICGEPPCGYLNLLNETSFKKVSDLFNDLYQDSFDVFIDDVVHVGGDEVSTGCYGNSTNTLYNEWMMNRITFLHKHNKTACMWAAAQNINSDYGQKNGSLEVINVAWYGSSKYDALKNGFKVIDAESSYYYLDCGMGNWQRPTGNSWCNPYKPWGVIYNHSLYDDIPTNESGLYRNIMGGMVLIWGEEVDDGNFEARVWVRAAAAAERWWNHKMELTVDTTDAIWLRLSIQRYWMKHQGIMSTPITPRYCVQNNEYCAYKRHPHGHESNDNTVNMYHHYYKYLLTQYELSKYIKMFELEGWTMVEYWNEIDVQMLQQWGFKSGDIVKFKHLIQNTLYWTDLS